MDCTENILVTCPAASDFTHPMAGAITQAFSLAADYGDPWFDHDIVIPQARAKREIPRNSNQI
jgi:hypothetical protein